METHTHLPPRHARSHGATFDVAHDVAGLRTWIVNLFFIGDPTEAGAGWVLVDAGMPLSASRIRSAAEARFGDGNPPRAILMTHGHFDHVGALEELAEQWDVPVYAHALEVPYLTGRSKYPPPDPTVGGGLMARMSELYPRGPVNLGSRVRTLPADHSVPELPGWTWIHTPGHSPGHVSFFRERDRLLIAGDAFVTTKQESLLSVMTQHKEVHGPPAYYTSDWAAAGNSVRALAALSPAIAATGHGLPMCNPRLAHELNVLAREFDRVAVPAHGRYVACPAIADERGVVWMPPTVPDPLRKVLAAVAVTLGAAMLVHALSARAEE
jgi:glyoxylase-like metal-dependent hydrolase (beta-lactamase superfamily II)